MRWTRLVAPVVGALAVGTLVAGSWPGAEPASGTPPHWADQDVSFVAGGLLVHATFRHPVGASGDVPAVLLIAGSGPTDRDGNSALEPGPVDTLKTLADWLSADGVASLRYDKLGSGATGLGPYAVHPDSIGIRPFEQESVAALRFLASRRGVNRHLLGVVGHSEGALFALLLATGAAGAAPPVHALGLLEPLSLRYLDLITVQVRAQVASQVTSGVISRTLAAKVNAALDAAVTRLRTHGTVAATLPYGLATVFNPATAKFLAEADHWDPAELAASLPARTPVLITCSSADVQVTCGEVRRVVDALSLAHAATDFVRLKDVDHVLKVDPTGNPANYTKRLAFSPTLRRALARFVAQNL